MKASGKARKGSQYEGGQGRALGTVGGGRAAGGAGAGSWSGGVNEKYGIPLTPKSGYSTGEPPEVVGGW